MPSLRHAVATISASVPKMQKALLQIWALSERPDQYPR
jgi:hypothetical protein